jgi:5'-methylthioadenosine phosphorylase
VGSLQRHLGAGSFVVPDQLADRTWGRGHTYFDGTDGVGHVSFADPFCPNGRAALLAVAAESSLDPIDGGTLVVINGPRFSSRAESLWHAAQGWSIVGMTTFPEASLARELALCYSTISLVTDHDAGFEGEDAVSQEQVFAVFADNIERMRGALLRTVAALPTARDCPCPRSLDGLTVPFALP